MGVYIDMEMPKEGFVEILIRDDGTVQQTGQSYRIDGTDYYTPYVGEMPVMYKAVSVPEPHGRLGDLDALDIYQRAEAARAEYQEDEDNSYLEGMADGLCEAAKQLSVARTIIPANEEG